MKPIDPHWQAGTLGVRAAAPETLSRDHSLPIALTSSFTFESAAQAAAAFADQEAAFIYSRFTNPTVQAFEQRLAAMEGGESCVATASGMAAIFTLCMAVLKTGDHLLTSRGLFGSTIQVFNNWLSRVGISVTYVDMTDLASEACLDPSGPRLLHHDDKGGARASRTCPARCQNRRSMSRCGTVPSR